MSEKSIIERLENVKAVSISYFLRMSHKTEETFSFTAHYYIGLERNTTHIGMPSTTATYGVSLSSSVMDVVDNFGLEAKIVGIMSGGGGNIWIVGRH